MTDWQRLEKVIRWTGLSTNAFAVGIGLKRSENLYQIKRGSYGISKDLAELISRKYPQVSPGWLLTGLGEMLLQDEHREGGKKQPDDLPYYPDISTAILAETRSDVQPAYFIRVPSFGICDVAVPAVGGSMAPDIPAGTILALRRTGTEFLLPGEAYLVVTEGFAAVRYVRWLDEEQTRLVLATAGGKKEEEIVVAAGHVKRLYLVKGLLINKV